MKRYIARGIRNNNPLNIRIGNEWKGEVEKPTDPVFEQFTEMKWGVRAGFILLKRYIQRYGLNTIVEIINRWAPSSENHTGAYIDFVTKQSGINMLTDLDFNDKTQMCSLVQAMILYECGQPIDINDILEGYELAK